jgi:Ca2+-binding RTX toxin-like protein
VIWDTGGRSDWLDAASYTTDVSLSLTPGEFSRFGVHEDVVIAFGVDIEHARGGSGHDTITGNDMGNKLYGGTGNDEILGGGGKDTLIGNNGADTLRGGDKEDYLNGGKGNDLLFGDNQRDVLFGSNGRDRLDGGRADDTLEGGRGNDTFIFRTGGDADTIIDFENDRDRVLFEIDGISNRSQAAAFATQDGADTVYDFGDGDVLRILNMTVADMLDDFNVI